MNMELNINIPKDLKVSHCNQYDDNGIWYANWYELRYLVKCCFFWTRWKPVRYRLMDQTPRKFSKRDITTYIKNYDRVNMIFTENVGNNPEPKDYDMVPSNEDAIINA